MEKYIDANILRKNEVARCHCVPCIGSNDNNYKDLDEVLNDCPPADVVPKSEVDKLLEVNADLNESLRLAAEVNKDLQVELAAMRTAANSYKMHYENLAREIFEEIEKLVVSRKLRNGLIGDLLESDIAKLKKKIHGGST